MLNVLPFNCFPGFECWVPNLSLLTVCDSVLRETLVVTQGFSHHSEDNCSDERNPDDNGRVGLDRWEQLQRAVYRILDVDKTCELHQESKRNECIPKNDIKALKQAYGVYLVVVILFFGQSFF